MFPHHSPSVCRLLPSRWGSGLKTSSPSFVLHLEILTTEIATPLLWLFLVQRREEKGVARALLRAQLGAKLGFFFLRVLNFQKSLPCLLVCLLHVSHSQPTITGNRGTFWLQRLRQLQRGGVRCRAVSGKSSYFKVCGKPHHWSSTDPRLSAHQH